MKKIFWLVGLIIVILPLSTFAAQKELQAVADSVVDHAYPERNYGGEMLEVSARNIEKQSFIKFNAANGLPRGSTVNRAYLKLYTWGDGCYDNVQSMNVKAVRITRPWNQETITWNNSPDTTTSGMSSHTIPIRDDTRYETWDVTNIVKSWVEQNTPDYGFKLYYYNGSVECSASFFSREFGGNMQKPYLVIDYTPQINLRDVFPPIISDVSVEHLSTTAVDIHWTTNEPATTKAEFGRVGVYDRSSPIYSGYRTSHIARVDGLEQGTAYNYRIISADSSGNKAVLDDQTFTTFRDGSQPHSTPSNAPSTSTPTPASNSSQSGVQLHIQNIFSDVTGPTTAKIKWYSRPTGTSWVFVSATAGSDTPIGEYGEPQGQNDDAENHQVNLLGLSASTTYSYRVATRTNDNQWSVSGVNKFTTLPIQNSSFGNNSSSNSTEDQQADNQTENNFSSNSNNTSSGATTNPQAAEDAREEIINFLEGDISKTYNSKPAKTPNSNLISDRPVSKLMLAIWMGTRLLVPTIIIVAIILFIIFWLKRRNKEEEKTQTIVSNKNDTKATANSVETLRQTAPKNKLKMIIIIVIIVLCLLAWKIASFLFPFL